MSDQRLIALREAESSLSHLEDYPHQPNCGAVDDACATCYGLMIREDIRVALAETPPPGTPCPT